VRAREPVEVGRAEAALGLAAAVQAVVEPAGVVRVALVAWVQEALTPAVAVREVAALARGVLEQALGLAQVQGRVQEPARALERALALGQVQALELRPLWALRSLPCAPLV
jgi:hypothetical protein